MHHAHHFHHSHHSHHSVLSDDKRELFENAPVGRALATMAVPTIISQLINLVYNMVDAFFIGRTGNSYMTAATTLTLTLFLLTIVFSNLFGIGGGSLIARLMGQHRDEEAKSVSAYSFYGAVAAALIYGGLLGIFVEPVLKFMGASSETLGYAKSYTLIVIVAGGLPTLVSATLAHLLRNTGYAKQASLGLSSGGVLNMILDPIFMFLLLPEGYEVVGAALATLISNIFSCVYLLIVFKKASAEAPLSLSFRDAKSLSRENLKGVFSVGIPSAVLTGLFDVANMFVNVLAAEHNDLVLAAMGIVMKIDRIPNAVNLGLCQGMMPIVAYNFASGDHGRMKKTISTARLTGLAVSAVSIVALVLLAAPATRLFLSTGGENAETALTTVGIAAVFLRIRCLASPVQFINYHSSYCMQAMGDGKRTMLHAVLRELVFYIPLMFLMDALWGENGLAASLIAGEFFGAVSALILLRRAVNGKAKN